MEHYGHHSFEKCRNQNAQDFESLVLGREWACVIFVEETCIMGDWITTWQYCLKTDLMEENMRSI